MFSIFKKRSLRPENKKILALVQRILNYRSDVLSIEDLTSLKTIESSLKNNEVVDKTEIEDLLNRCGGNIYPQGKLAEYTELIVVSLILACGIRGFIAQPFKIPTNSMYPTYNGVVTNVCEQPSTPLKWVNKILLGNSYYEIKNTSAGTGEISLALNVDLVNRSFNIKPVRGNEKVDIYQFFIGNNSIEIEFPKDVSFENLITDTFFTNEAKTKNARQILSEKLSKASILPNGNYVLKLGKIIKPQETIFSFALKTGDMVLVDRVWYHFFKPAIGDPFVFKTGNIPGLNNQKLYYIKRLAGTPGDQIKIENKQLFVNKKLPAGTTFEANNSQKTELNYFGYLPTCGSKITQYSWSLIEPFTVPENYYYALGDNSYNSYDSRGWGGVPVSDTIGPARLIIYPLSNHWGIAK